MALRPFWKGYLKLSLVTCPVAMTAATSEDDKVRFHVLNRRTGNRISANLSTPKPASRSTRTTRSRATPAAKTTTSLLEDEELESIALESTRTIDIETFVPPIASTGSGTIRPII